VDVERFVSVQDGQMRRFPEPVDEPFEHRAPESCRRHLDAESLADLKGGDAQRVGLQLRQMRHEPQRLHSPQQPEG